MSSLWRHDLRLFARQRIAIPALLLMALASAASLWVGSAEIDRQNQIIARIQPQQAADEAAIAAWVAKGGDAGNAAYYTFHATWDAPSPLAFIALGQRDIAPFVLRVRALALEGQIQETETYNAELALPGRFDWAFVLTYLMPLLLIALLYDLIASERESGRLPLLSAMARSERGLWVRRVVLRCALLLAALLLPFVVAAVVLRAGAGALMVAGVAAGYLVVWAGICVLVARTRLTAAASAAILASLWLTVTIILPSLALLAVNSAIPVRQGIELTLAQREAVHAGWDQPKDGIMQPFFARHPHLPQTPPLPAGFDWRWYYAFHHMGDVSVASQVDRYVQGLKARDRWTVRVGLLLPSVGVQVALHRMAQTDLRAQLAYQDRIRDFHRQLRAFYYGYIFEQKPFGLADFARAPRWPEAVPISRP